MRLHVLAQITRRPAPEWLARSLVGAAASGPEPFVALAPLVLQSAGICRRFWGQEFSSFEPAALIVLLSALGARRPASGAFPPPARARPRARPLAQKPPGAGEQLISGRASGRAAGRRGEQPVGRSAGQANALISLERLEQTGAPLVRRARAPLHAPSKTRPLVVPAPGASRSGPVPWKRAPARPAGGHSSAPKDLRRRRHDRGPFWRASQPKLIYIRPVVA